MRSKAYQQTAYYIENHAIPKKLGRVVYDCRGSQSKYIIELIKSHGLTPIPLATYIRLNVKKEETKNGLV